MAFYDRAGIIDRDNKRTREKKAVGIPRVKPAAEPAPSKPIAKAKKPIAKKGKKLSKEERIHGKIKKAYLQEHTVCECRREACRGEEAVDIHHKKGRGRYLNAPEFFLAVSRRCHDWIEKHTQEAYDLGLSVKRNGPKEAKK